MNKKTSKYIRLYGMTLQEIADHLCLSIVTVHSLLNGKRRKRHESTQKKIDEFLGAIRERAQRRIEQ